MVCILTYIRYHDITHEINVYIYTSITTSHEVSTIQINYTSLCSQVHAVGVEFMYIRKQAVYAGFPNLAVQLPRITVQDLCTNNDIYIGR